MKLLDRDLVKNNLLDSMESLRRRVDILERLLRGQGPATGPGFGNVLEGPGIDIVNSVQVGLGGDTILLYNSDGTPVEEWPATEAGLIQALAAAASGDTVEWPSLTISITAAITIPAGVTLRGRNRERSIISFSGAATGTFNLITVNANSVLSDCTINATYTDNATAVRTVWLVTGRAYRLVVNSTKESGNGDLYGVRGTVYETTTTIEEAVVDVVSKATTKVNYLCYGIYISNLGNDAGKRGVVRNLYGYALIDASVTNHYKGLTGLYLDGDASDIYIRSNEDAADYAYYSVGDNAQAYDCYGYAKVKNADAAGGANAAGIRVNTVAMYNCQGYAVSTAYSTSAGIVADFATLTNCLGHASGVTTYLENYERCIGISTDGQSAFYNCVGVAEDTGASASLITDGFFAGNDVLVGCTGKAVSSNGAANDIEFYAYCYLSGSNFSRLAWYSTPDDLYPLTGDRNFVAVYSATADTTLTQAHDVVLVDATGGNVVITLPAAASYKRRKYTIKRIDASTNTVTVDGNASETIDDQETITLAQYTSLQIACDGTEWWIL